MKHGNDGLNKAAYQAWELNQMAKRQKLIQAIQSGDTVEAEILLRQISQQELQKTSTLYLAAKKGMKGVCEQILEKYPEAINTVTEDGHTLLTLSSEKGNTSLVEFLIQKNSSLIDTPHSNGSNALHFAAQEGHIEVVKLLLSKFPNIIDSRGKNDNTALHFAALTGKINVCELLTQKLNSDIINAINKSNETAFQVAAEMGHGEVCKLLISNMSSEMVHHELISAIQNGFNETTKKTFLEIQILQKKARDREFHDIKEELLRIKTAKEAVEAKLKTVSSIIDFMRVADVDKVEREKLKQALNTQKIKEIKEAKLKALEEEKVKEYTPEMDLSKTKLFLIETSQEVNSSDSYNNAIKRVSSLIRDGNDRLQERTDKGILLLGNTSAGKSTLAHLLSGRKLQGIKDEETGDMIIDALQPLKDIVIGHKMASETKIPNKCLANGTVIWDCPGFNDTEPDQEIANSFYIKRLSETIDQIKLILVVPEHHIVRDNGKHFIDTLSSFMKTFSNLDAMEGSISLIITQVPANKEPQHIEKSIERILRDNQGVTEEQKILVTKLNSSLHLFHRPTQEGELIAINPLEYINSSCQYVKGNPGMASIIVSKAAMKYSYHLLETAASNFNKILEVTVRAIADATNCLNVNKNNLFVQNYPMIKDWVPESVHYNKLVLHEKNEYFLELDLLNKLQKILTSNKISSILDGLNVLQRVIETIAEYVDSGISSKHQIQDYGYCLQQQYEYVKFFASVCGKELPGEASLAELLALCSSKVLENLEFQVSNLHIDQTQLDKSYYRKAIDYLEKYPDSKPCTKLNALCYSGWASVAECKGESDLAIGLYLKAIKVNNQIPEVYEKLGMLFYSKGQYTKAIEAYKAVNNEFKIKECFKAWLTQDAENPDIMLMQAEYFESIGRFEAARKYYGFASSLSKNETFKSNICQKISGTLNSQTQNITLKAQEFSQKALTQEFYNFDAFKFVVETMDTQVIPNQKKPQKVSAKVTEPVKHVVQTGADKLDATWYDYLAIKDSLIKKGIDAKHILNTVKNNDELAVELDKIKEANSFYIIPLNVNALDGGFGTTSHWVGLHICTNAEAQIIAVKYLNPIGQKINKLLSGIISQKTGIVPKDITFGEGPQFAYEELEIELKGNINDCGPMLVQLFYELVNNGEILTKLLNEEESLAFGQKCRKEQKYDEGNELKETFTISGTVEVPEAIPTIAESDLAGVNSVLITDSAHC